MTIIEVLKDKSVKDRDHWCWRVVIRSKTNKYKYNVLYRGSGYNRLENALKQARSHNKKLLKPLQIKIYGKHRKGYTSTKN